MIATVTAWLMGSEIGRALLKWGVIIGGVLLAIFLFKRHAENAGRLAERVEREQASNDAVKRMLKVDPTVSKEQVLARLRAGTYAIGLLALVTACADTRTIVVCAPVDAISPAVQARAADELEAAQRAGVAQPAVLVLLGSGATLRDRVRAACPAG